MVALAVPAVFSASASASGPSITVTPSSGLVDSQLVVIAGSGFGPGPLFVFECRVGPAPACDLARGVTATADAGGAFFVSLAVHSSFVDDIPGGAGDSVDCSVGFGCQVVASQSMDAFAATPITFGTPPIGPSITVTPSSGLVDSQLVVVDGSGFGPGPLFVFECRVGAPACNFTGGVPATANAGGMFSTSLAVHVSFVGYDFPGGTADPVDCSVGFGCQVVASQSMDAFAATPITFATPDTTAPIVTLTTPSDGAIYAQGAVVSAAYSCADNPGGSGLASCVGTVMNGAAIDTSTSGAHSFTVTGTDNATNTASVIHHYAVLKVAATKDECKNGGWKTVVDRSLRPFKNQGDCVSFVATAGKNHA